MFDIVYEIGKVYLAGFVVMLFCSSIYMLVEYFDSTTKLPKPTRAFIFGFVVGTSIMWFVVVWKALAEHLRKLYLTGRASE